MPVPAGGPTAILPDWAPDLVAVAKYVPRRTMVAAVDGYGDPQNTFTADTHPNAPTVTALIGDAVAWVQAAVAAPVEATWPLATAAAALFAASNVELGYPDNRDDLTVADQLLARATAMRTDLDTANVAATGTDPENPDSTVLPVFSFPPAPWYGDYVW